VETIAVYWEPIIRVYGFEIVADASLLKVSLPHTETGFLGRHIAQLHPTGAVFLLVMFQYIDSRQAEICCVIRSEHTDTCRFSLENALKNHSCCSMETVTAVDLLFFHGPHFQDRYGIIDAAMHVLTDHAIELLAAGCAGTSVYLVMPKGAAVTAKALLAEAFTIPQHGPPVVK
jgi:hypothetical protein